MSELTRMDKISPFFLLQEKYKSDPWKMLVCCIMLNRTSRKQIDKVIDDFFKKYPDPLEASRADLEEMSSIISSLGFKKRRSKTIKRFSQDWINKNWKSIRELYGIGKYAEDSWQIFKLQNFEIEPKDKILKKYLDWIKENK